MKKDLFGSLMLLITAIVWGFAFVAQSIGGDTVGPFLFNGVRNVLGSVVLIPVILIIKKVKGIDKILTKEAIVGGVCCGLCLFVASSFQQFGILTAPVSDASFITALYVLIVPILGLFVGKKVGWKIWVAVAIALVGLYMLTMSGDMEFSKGDVLLLIGAFLFSIHILVIDYFSPKADGVVISSIQFFTAGVCAFIAMPFNGEAFDIVKIQSGLPSILYAGILSCGVAYTLQVVFQKDVEPTKASLILCLESVFGAIGGWLILGQTLGVKEIIGCALMFIAIIIAQL